MAASGAILQLTRHGLLECDSSTLLKKVSVDQVYSRPEFLDEVNTHKFYCKSDYANEFFLYFYLRVCEYSKLLGGYSQVKSDFFPWRAEWHIFFLARKKSKVRCGLGESFALALLSVLFVPILVVLSLTSVLLLVPFFLLRMGRSIAKKEIKQVRSLYLVRSKASEVKFDNLRKDNSKNSLVLVDDVFGGTEKGVSVYSPLKWSGSLQVVFSAGLTLAKELSSIASDVRVLLGTEAFVLVFFSYWLRFSHKALYGACLDRMLHACSKDVCVYSGNKEDRFAVLETKLSEKARLKLICIPHGLEYGFNFPMGLCGTMFYCNSSVAAERLNQLYGVGKFVFSEPVAKVMLAADLDDQSLVDRICYFSEPRDVSVNYLIIEELYRAGVDFYVKLHPLDDRSEIVKRFPNLKVIENIDEALSSSICLARKSTVLLEALYRGGKAIAVLLNKKDQVFFNKVFPALNDPRIEKATTIDGLLDKIK